jgi:hypothetical protein
LGQSGVEPLTGGSLRLEPGSDEYDIACDGASSSEPPVSHGHGGPREVSDMGGVREGRSVSSEQKVLEREQTASDGRHEAERAVKGVPHTEDMEAKRAGETAAREGEREELQKRHAAADRERESDEARQTPPPSPSKSSAALAQTLAAATPASLSPAEREEVGDGLA